MRNPKKVLDICDNPDLQADLFELSRECDRICERVASKVVGSSLSSVSSWIAEDHDHSRSQELMEMLAEIFASERLEEVLEEELDRYLIAPLYSVGCKSFDSEGFSGLVLYEDAAVRVSLVTIGPVALRLKKVQANQRESNTGITVQGSDTLVRFVRSGCCVAQFWSAEQFAPNDALEQRRIAKKQKRKISESESIFLRGGVDAMSITSCELPVSFLSVSRTSTRSSVNVHYRVTGELASCTAASMQGSRIQMLATFVREMAWMKGADDLVDLASHADHFVRWHVLRELTALCPATAYPHVLKAATDDAHPQVREAALKTRMLIEGVLQCH